MIPLKVKNIFLNDILFVAMMSLKHLPFIYCCQKSIYYLRKIIIKYYNNIQITRNIRTIIN